MIAFLTFDLGGVGQ
ncbi:hypothetical protein [Caulobacter vibrioides]|nr:hypothetical protein [Caulobacter vibrioides]